MTRQALRAPSAGPCARPGTAERVKTGSLRLPRGAKRAKDQLKDTAMNQLAHIAPASDYDTIRAAIRYLSENGPDTTDLAKFARALGLTERQLTDLFRRWCGLSPKSFAQAVALNHAKSLLREQASVLDTTYEVGLSST